MAKKRNFEEGLKEIIKNCKENNILKDFFESHSEEEVIGMLYTELFSDYICEMRGQGLSEDEIKAKLEFIANS